jgi:hypothetical protein
MSPIIRTRRAPAGRGALPFAALPGRVRPIGPPDGLGWLTRQAAIPQVTPFRTVDCTALEALRAEIGVSPLPIFIAALVRTGSVDRQRAVDRRTSPRDDVHVAIAVDTEHGLVAPVTTAPSAYDPGLRGETNASQRPGRTPAPDDLAAQRSR